MIQESIPMKVEEAMNSPNRENWCEAMQTEMSSLERNMVDLPGGARIRYSKGYFPLKATRMNA